MPSITLSNKILDIKNTLFQELDTSWYLSQVQGELSSISASHKDWHGAISRFGKVIDKQLTENVSSFTNK